VAENATAGCPSCGGKPGLTSRFVLDRAPLIVVESSHISIAIDHPLWLVGEVIVLRVWDASRTPPVLGIPDLDDEGGRGLCLVDLLARDWGYYRPASGGKVVWCTLAAPPTLPREPFSRRSPPGVSETVKDEIA
jgi:hypothetical protein